MTRGTALGATEGGGNYSAGVLMHALNDGRYVISHIERGQWSAYVREKNIRQWAEDDARVYPNYEVGIEQEPGSAGKDVAEATVRNLAGFSVFVDKVTGSKETRANQAMIRSAEDIERVFKARHIPMLQESVFKLPKRIDLKDPPLIDVTPAVTKKNGGQ